jgi:hypothetical protein
MLMALAAVAPTLAPATPSPSAGQLYAFGENKFGQLGNATNNKTEEPNPTPTPVTLPGEVGPVTQVAAGAHYSLALTGSGQLFGFGANRYGQLGNATHNRSSEPNAAPTQVTLPGELGPVTQIAAGFDHSLALTSSSQLYAFGANGSGQLGNATNNKTSEPNPTPTRVTLLGEVGPVVQIAAGESHSLALTSSGQLYAFGANGYGELGNATNNKSGAPNPTPQLVTLPGELGLVIQIAAGADHSLALTSSGQLFAFGSNRYGQLGYPTNIKTDDPNPTPTLVTLPGGATIETVARGPQAEETLAVTADLAVVGSPPDGVVGVPYRAQLQATGGAPPYSWRASGLPPGLSINPASGVLSGTPSALGNYATAFTVTDSYGIEASAPLPIRINAPPSAIKALPAPTISKARQSASRWREGGKLAEISRRKRRPPIGSTFSFSLNEQASVSFAFTQQVSGRKVGRTCVAKTHRNARRKRCTRTTTAGTLSFAAHDGMNKVVFQGRLSRSKRLAPGPYTLVIKARNAAGQESAPVRLSFRIVR